LPIKSGTGSEIWSLPWWLMDFAQTRDAVHEAEGSLQQALAVAQAQGAKLWELRAVTSLARLWHDRGRTEEARDLLAPICGWFSDSLDTPDLTKAKSVLAALAETRTMSPAHYGQIRDAD
jgi:predicted ATPase